MAIVVLKLLDVKRKTETHPKRCSYCAGETFQRWGPVNKPVKDIRVRNIKVYRYRCCHCHRTFRHYPAGITRADQTERLRLFATLLWTLSLSHRARRLTLSGLKVSVSHKTIWRDVQDHARQMQQRKHWQPIRAVGLDGAYILGWGATQPVLVAIDLGTGAPFALGDVNEYDPAAVRRWLEPLVQRHGITVMVTDDWASYKVVAEKLQLGHQICQFHVRRWVGKALKHFQDTLPEEWRWVLEEVRQLLEVLAPTGSKRLDALWKQLPGRRSKRDQPRSALEQLRDLLLRLCQDWPHYCTFQSERAIGRMKMRARTVRGYKSWPGMQTGLLLAGSALP